MNTGNPGSDLPFLKNRVRVGLGIILMTGLLFLVLDLLIVDTNAKILILKAVQIGIVFAAFAGIRLVSTANGTIAIALATIAISFSTAAASGVISGDSATTRLLCVALSLGSAALIPWGTAAQCIVAGLGVTATIANMLLLHSWDPPVYPTSGAIFSIVASIVISREYSRTRVKLAESLTQRSAAEADLRESEEKFRGAFDNAPVGMAIVAIDGRWQKVNRRLCQIVGYSERELLELDFQTITHPDDLAEDLDLVGKTLAGEIDSYQLDKRYFHKNGNIVCILLAVSLVRDDSGTPLYFISQIEDVTARKEAEAERDRLFELSPDMLCVLDTSGKLKRFNPAFGQILGYGNEELLRIPLFDFVHPDDRASTIEDLSHLDNDHDTLGFINRCRAKDGSYRWLDWNARLSGDGSIYAIARDLTERAEALQGTVDALSARIAILDDSGKILAVNTAWRRFAEGRGFADPTHGVGRRYFDLGVLAAGSDTSIAATIHDKMQRLVTDGDEVVIQYPLQRESDTSWFELRASRFTIHDTPRIVVAHEDITIRRLAEENLREARDQAVQASRLKSDFLAAMSHEIRTPLSAIMGFVDLLRDTPLTEEQRDFADTVARSARALLNIVSDVLDMAKIEAGRVEIEEIPFVVRDLVREVCDLFAPEAWAKGLRLQAELAESLSSSLVGDPARIRQILTNLVGNAVKFTDQGEVTIRVGVIPVGGDTVRLQCDVIDTGIGIDETRRELLFDAFQQADASTSRRYGGSGLGLTICKQLLALMGGYISVASTVGKGSSFRFDLPLKRCTTAIADSTPSEIAVPTLRPAADADGPVRVLLVEDNQTNQKMVSRLLAKLGCIVDIAGGGREALSQLAKHSYALVLMDCAMPEMDGYETTRRIRQSENGFDRHLPIIALTADVTAAARERCLASGMDSYISKPVSLAQLAEVISSQLAHADYPTRSPSDSLAAEREAERLAFLDRVGHDLTLAREMREIFLQEYPRLVERLRSSIESEAFPDIEQHAHSLKGSVANFTQGPALALAAKLETMARQAQAGDYRHLLKDLQSELEQLGAWLRSIEGEDLVA